ncbi:MAG: SAM-dependent chlorinase/fluorinase [Fimbriimonadales bacterium]|nr:SAM-dependent chlorinase/fluorinase [Fimbriimonadales bacterium]
MSRLVALLTDYGYTDTYVAQVKAVLLSLCPTCEILDLTHGVAPQNVRSGAYLLATATPYLPDGAIIIAVVDPGVGTERRAIAVKASRHTYLAPDNGLLSLALRDDAPLQAVSLDNPRYHLPDVSSTFHGRDIFAPCAAHLANGVPIDRLGTPVKVDTLVQLPDIAPEFGEAVIRCKPLHIDHFGNVVFNLRRDVFERFLRGTGVSPVQSVLERDAQATPRGTGVSPVQPLLERDAQATKLPLVRTFGDVGWGEPLAYWGSNGYLEVAVNGGSAAEKLGIGYDTLLEVQVDNRQLLG